MKRTLTLLLTICTVLSLAACGGQKDNGNTTPTSEPTSAPRAPTSPATEPTVPSTTPITFRQEAPFSKEGVPKFMALLHAKYPKTVANIVTREEDCYNDTPPEVAAETNIQFFSFSYSMKTLIMVENEIYVLVNANFSAGACERLMNALPYDFDGDGVKDVLIAHCRENGGSYGNRVSVFNPVSKELTDLYFANDKSHKYGLYVTASNIDGQVSYTVLRVTMDYAYETKGNDDHELISKEYTVIGTEGYIEIKDGVPQFVAAHPTTHSDKGENK